MNKIQACKLSTFIVKNGLGSNLKIYDDVQGWDIDNENSDCDFYISIREYTDGEIELGISMKHIYNKFKDCPIIVRFPKRENDWKNLVKFMMKLRSDCIPTYLHELGYLINKRLKNEKN